MMITFCSLTNSYWTVCAFTDKQQLGFLFEHHRMSVSLPISICFWYEFHMEALKHTWINNVLSAQF
jgi:hypothetical protein